MLGYKTFSYIFFISTYLKYIRIIGNLIEHFLYLINKTLNFLFCPVSTNDKLL